MQLWYTLHTKPNAEHQVATALRERGLQVFLPEIKSPTLRHKERRRPFFPCYLFIKIDLERVGLSRVRWTPGLRRVVAFDDRPVPLRDEAIDLMRRKLEAINAAGGWSANTFQPGERVRITEGPLKGMLAIFDGPSKPSERVRVLLDFLGDARRAEVSAASLEKLPRNVHATVPKRPRRTRGRGRRIN